MPALHLLAVELRDLDRRLNSGRIDKALLRRFNQVIAEINTTPPEDIGIAWSRSPGSPTPPRDRGVLQLP